MTMIQVALIARHVLLFRRRRHPKICLPTLSSVKNTLYLQMTLSSHSFQHAACVTPNLHLLHPLLFLRLQHV